MDVTTIASAAPPPPHPATDGAPRVGVEMRVAAGAPTPRRAAIDDALPSWVTPVVAAVGLVTASVALRSPLPAHHWWGRIALVGYGAALAVWFLTSSLAHGPLRTACRTALGPGLIGVCGLVPLAVLVIGRARGWHHVAQSEVDVIESAAVRLVHHGTPYRSSASMTPTEAADHYSYFPYLPGLAFPGLLRAIAGRHWWTDSRLVMLAVDVAAFRWAWRRVGRSTRAALLALAASPLVTLPLAAGGHDVMIASLVLVGVVGVGTIGGDTILGGEPGAGCRPGPMSDVGLGLAASTTLLAWPLIAPTVWVRRSRHLLAVLGATAIMIAVPMLVDPRATITNVIGFPAGRTPAHSPADAPSIGRLLRAGPHGPALAGGFVALVALGYLLSLWRRPVRSDREALARAAVGFTALIVAVPAARTGYLLHPTLLGALWWSSRHSADRAGPPDFSEIVDPVATGDSAGPQLRDE